MSAPCRRGAAGWELRAKRKVTPGKTGGKARSRGEQSRALPIRNHPGSARRSDFVVGEVDIPVWGRVAAPTEKTPYSPADSALKPQKSATVLSVSTMWLSLSKFSPDWTREGLGNVWLAAAPVTAVGKGTLGHRPGVRKKARALRRPFRKAALGARCPGDATGCVARRSDGQW
jgi:hypothetical protein